jgi:uncharacterized protein (DUF608 family)
MKSNTFSAGFPIARIDFTEPSLPLLVHLEAFNPFIPLDEKNSSIPSAVFLFHLKNPTRNTVRIKLISALENICDTQEEPEGENSCIQGRHASGILYTNPRIPKDSPHFISLALGSTWKKQRRSTSLFSDPDAQPGRSDKTSWKFWTDFEKNGSIPEIMETVQEQRGAGALVLETSLEAGETKTLPVIIVWYNPVSCAGASCCSGDGPCTNGWKTYVSSCFSGAAEVLDYTAGNLQELEQKTRLFRKRFYSSTIPGCALEAAGSQISILKSTTCLRFENGDFWGWEGVSNTTGCCAGTCTHVWNYAQALPFLYPSLARSIHNQQFSLSTGENGKMCFRQPLPPGSKADIESFHACGDGQLGTVMRVYREWLISGDDAWLKSIWPRCKQALEYTWLYWDADKDGVIEGVQHNTYDNEFWGPNSMMGTMYLGALRAAEELSRYLGDDESASEYRRIFESGKKKTDMHDHACFYRSYAMPGEKGLILCSWPEGNEPPYPFWFASEVWSGIEYQTAAHMIIEGMVDEGLSVVKGVRDRYSGLRRNPWDEIECGHHYSRSMASYALLNALGGFFYSALDMTIGINPKIKAKDFRLFFCVGSGWGGIKRKEEKNSLSAEIAIDYGSLRIKKLVLPAAEYSGGTALLSDGAALLSEKKLSFNLERSDGQLVIEFEEAVDIEEGNRLTIKLKQNK